MLNRNDDVMKMNEDDFVKWKSIRTGLREKVSKIDHQLNGSVKWINTEENYRRDYRQGISAIARVYQNKEI